MRVDVCGVVAIVVARESNPPSRPTDRPRARRMSLDARSFARAISDGFYLSRTKSSYCNARNFHV